MSDTVTLSGTVADVFAHRFTLKGEGGTVLADLGPKGAERIRLAPGDVVTVTGDAKPSEIKVRTILRAGETVEVPQGPKPHGKPHGRPGDRSEAA